mmetsp:Transcript_69378/g.192045  ORF Transcript_69378/g.192045 Transcript_69378/m.192045 type:complete len:309 (+) Transcript_69378:332-1258(+)
MRADHLQRFVPALGAHPRRGLLLHGGQGHPASSSALEHVSARGRGQLAQVLHDALHGGAPEHALALHARGQAPHAEDHGVELPAPRRGRRRGADVRLRRDVGALGDVHQVVERVVHRGLERLQPRRQVLHLLPGEALALRQALLHGVHLPLGEHHQLAQLPLPLLVEVVLRGEVALAVLQEVLGVVVVDPHLVEVRLRGPLAQVDLVVGLVGGVAEGDVLHLPPVPDGAQHRAVHLLTLLAVEAGAGHDLFQQQAVRGMGAAPPAAAARREAAPAPEVFEQEHRLVDDARAAAHAGLDGDVVVIQGRH